MDPLSPYLGLPVEGQRGTVQEMIYRINYALQWIHLPELHTKIKRVLTGEIDICPPEKRQQYVIPGVEIHSLSPQSMELD